MKVVVNIVFNFYSLSFTHLKLDKKSHEFHLIVLLYFLFFDTDIWIVYEQNLFMVSMKGCWLKASLPPLQRRLS